MPFVRLITWAFVALLAASPVCAEQREVSGGELEALLSGNSIDGMWGQTHYVQVFTSSGRTGYRADGSAVDWGSWRIGPQGRYCSIWRGGGESCYPVIEQDGALHWLVESSGVLHPFTVVEGNLLEQ